jgi:hypothetical protein
VKFSLSKLVHLLRVAAAVAVSFGGFGHAAAASKVVSEERSPVGAYLWFPEPGGPKSDQDCRDLVAQIRPTKEKAEMSLWGTIPENDPAAGSFYVLLSDSRMEPTFAAEGDYDFGNIRLGETSNGETPFTLVPDDHPDVTINGMIVAKPGSEIVTVILRGIPVDSTTTDRTTYYCRFEDLGTET